MGLIESIEEDEKKLQEVETEEVVEAPVEAKEEPKEEPAEEQKEEPKEEKPEEKPEVGVPAIIKLRQENARLKKEMAERQQPVQTQVTEKEDTQPIQLPAEVAELVEQQKVNKAGAVFSQLEEEVKNTIPDYEDVSNQYKAAIDQSVRLHNPRMNHEEVLAAANRAILTKAANYYAAGADPIVSLYEEAKLFGIQPRPKEEPKEEVERKPDLNKLAKNMDRSAGMAGAKGRGATPNITAQSAVSMSLSEFAAMSPAELEALERGA